MIMNKLTRCLLAGLIGGAALINSHAQGFDSGSTGALGALNVEANMTVALPPDGRLHYTTVNVAPGATLRFGRNALNTPVYLLAQGDVVINGTVDVQGNQAPGNPPIGGSGGPGGFDGGKPGFGEIPPGPGYGPGGGAAGEAGGSATSAGGGTYSARSGSGGSLGHGQVYGSALLIPLVGGSGGGGDTGSPGSGGGGGGGAILIASSSKIAITGRIDARGGTWRGTSHNGGSGGAIRLLAPRVEGAGILDVTAPGPGGGLGRIRVDLLDRTALSLNFQPLSATTVGSNMFVEPDVVPRLDIVEAAGRSIAVGTGEPVRIQLPFGSDPNRSVTIEAKDFNAEVPIQLTLTPDAGSRIVIDGTIDNRTENPKRVTFPVTLPPNTLVTINAWTR